MNDSLDGSTRVDVLLTFDTIGYDLLKTMSKRTTICMTAICFDIETIGPATITREKQIDYQFITILHFVAISVTHRVLSLPSMHGTNNFGQRYSSTVGKRLIKHTNTAYRINV